ncbi:hypothetical protein [Gimesia sp.]|uniref:hypothetical protein n=1 Tax=Gimesia sp. TaxID=2024833 RepID=UPI003A9162AE
MEYDFNQCRDVLYGGLIKSLGANADRLRSLAKNDSYGVNALSYDILPWHSFAALSFRATTDDYIMSHSGDYKLDIRYSPADWKYCEFIDNGTLDQVREYTASIYPQSGGTTGQEALHVILLAAADALLDDEIGRLLHEYGFDDTIRRDKVPWGGFEYVVLDVDKAFKANYCEIVLANRVANRLLGRVV